MAEVVNLRLARKAKRRADGATTASRNRAAFGTTKGERLRAAKNAERFDKALDGAERERQADPPK